MATVIGLKVSWDKILVLPAKVFESISIACFLEETKIVDTYEKKLIEVDYKDFIAGVDTTTIVGWDKPQEVIAIEEILAENNRLTRENEKLQKELLSQKAVTSPSTDISIVE